MFSPMRFQLDAAAARRRATVIAVALALLALAAPSAAQQPGWSQKQIHDPFSPRYNALTPAHANQPSLQQMLNQHGAWQGSGFGAGGWNRSGRFDRGVSWNRGVGWNHGVGWNRGMGWNGGVGWNRSFIGGTNLTVVGPGYYSSFMAGSFWPGYFPGVVGIGGWAGPMCGWGWRGGYPYYPYPYVLPPVQIPAGVMFGPRAVWSMMTGPDLLVPGALVGNNVGANIDNLGDRPELLPQPDPQVRPVRRVQPEALLPNAAADRPIKVRKTNDAARARALRMLVLADEDFRAQKYAEAMSRYRRAVQAAPDIAEPLFRQAQVEIALSRYEAAAKSSKRAVEVEPGWLGANFRLENLYGPNLAAQQAHLEKLAQQAAARPHDADLRYLIGMELFFDGQYERARRFFEQAAALHPGDDQHVLTFLREIDRRAPAPLAEAVDL